MADDAGDYGGGYDPGPPESGGFGEHGHGSQHPDSTPQPSAPFAGREAEDAWEDEPDIPDDVDPRKSKKGPKRRKQLPTQFPAHSGFQRPKFDGVQKPENQGFQNPVHQVHQHFQSPAHQGFGNPAHQGLGNPAHQGLGGPVHQGLGNTVHQIQQFFQHPGNPDGQYQQFAVVQNPGYAVYQNQQFAVMQNPGYVGQPLAVRNYRRPHEVNGCCQAF